MNAALAAAEAGQIGKLADWQGNKMESSKQPEEQERAGASTRSVEAVVAALVLAFGALVIIGSWKLGSGWTSDGPGAGYFPFYIGSILCLAGAGIFVQTLLGKGEAGGIFVDREQLRRVSTVLFPAALYVLAVSFLGFYMASALYIALFMLILGKYSWTKSVLTALITSGLLYAMFEMWFKVPLFKSALGF